MGFRRKARELALQMLFQIDFNKNQPKDRFPDTFWSEKKVRPDVKAFTESLVGGVIRHQDRIDRTIEKYTEHWATGRMGLVDRNILRFSIFELFYLNEIPPKVSINEAIEIAKIYGNSESSAFINGILDHIHRDITTEKSKPKDQKTG